MRLLPLSRLLRKPRRSGAYGQRGGTAARHDHPLRDHRRFGLGQVHPGRGLGGGPAGGLATLVSEDWYYRDCSAFRVSTPPPSTSTTSSSATIRCWWSTSRRCGPGGRSPPRSMTSPPIRAQPNAGRAVAPAQVVIVEGTHLFCAAEVAGLFDLRSSGHPRRRALHPPPDARPGAARPHRPLGDRPVPGHRPPRPPPADPSSRARADLVVTDPSTTVDNPDMDAVSTLVKPLLRPPVFTTFKDEP